MLSIFNIVAAMDLHFHLANGNSVPNKQLPVSPSLQPLATTFLLSVSMNLMTFDTSHMWDHTVFASVCLDYFT